MGGAGDVSARAISISRPTRSGGAYTIRAPVSPPTSTTSESAVITAQRARRSRCGPTQVGESIQVRHADVIGADPVVDRRCRGVRVKVPSTSGYVAPAIARSSIATTSSKTRRPFGKPARSPPSRPKALCRREASPSGRAMWRAETVRGSA
jgi:hypothetical protein